MHMTPRCRAICQGQWSDSYLCCLEKSQVLTQDAFDYTKVMALHVGMFEGGGLGMAAASGHRQQSHKLHVYIRCSLDANRFLLHYRFMAANMCSVTKIGQVLCCAPTGAPPLASPYIDTVARKQLCYGAFVQVV